MGDGFACLRSKTSIRLHRQDAGALARMSGRWSNNNLLLVLVFSLALWTSKIHAAEFSTEQDKDGYALIAVSGELVPEDEQRFKKLAAVFDDATVVLDSDGGSTIAAIKIGEAVKLKGYSTFVGEKMACSSACALIWLAGTPRFLDPNAKVGFHATYVEKDGRQQESGGGNALVGRYLTLLNLSERAVYFATSAPPSQLNYLTASNYKSLGIEVTILDDDEESVAPAPEVSVAEPMQKTDKEVSLWKAVGGWSVHVDHTLNNGCFALASNETSAFRIGFDVSDKLSSYFFVADESWKSIIVDKEYQLIVRFDDKQPWKTSAVGAKVGDLLALRSNFEADEFWLDFSTAKRLTISYNNSNIINAPTVNNDKAFAQLILCQNAQQALRKKDPFE